VVGANRTTDHLNYALAAEARSEASAPSNSYRRCFVDQVLGFESRGNHLKGVRRLGEDKAIGKIVSRSVGLAEIVTFVLGRKA
jgi:hypothetical protein